MPAAWTCLPSNATVGYLTQEREVVEGETLASYLARRTGVADAETAFNATAAALGLPGAAGGADEAYAAALERYLALGGPDLEARAGAVCAELDLPPALLGLAMSQLSGGQAARASLAALLLSAVRHRAPRRAHQRPRLRRPRSARGIPRQPRRWAVVVSHDRAFLERIVTSIGEIDAGSHRLTLFRGGWHAYLEAHATAQRHAEEAHVAFTAERDRLLARERQQRQWAVTGVAKATRNPRDNDKAQRDFRINRTEKQASKVRSTERALERLAPVPKPYEPWLLHLEMASAAAQRRRRRPARGRRGRPWELALRADRSRARLG